MGACTSTSKPPKRNPYAPQDLPLPPPTPPQSNNNNDKKPSSPFYNLTPVRFFQTKGTSPTTTPKTGPYFPPLSPARHIMAVLAKRLKGATEEVEGGMEVVSLDKRFGLSKRFKDLYEVGDEIGRGHFGFVVPATCKYGDHVGRKVAVKVIPKAKMTTSIAVEDVRRELKILQALSGHDNLLEFYDAFEDNDNVVRSSPNLEKLRVQPLYIMNRLEGKLKNTFAQFY
ncbi:CDPK-related kinase 5-like protein [Tanacetum coccineum]